MANNENLKPIKKGELSKEEAKKRGSKGGKKSGEKRRELKAFKEYLLTGLNTVVSDKSGKQVTAKEAGALKVIKKYVEGEYKFVELVLKILNEMPADKQEITNIIPQIIVEDEAHKKMLEDL